MQPTKEGEERRPLSQMDEARTEMNDDADSAETQGTTRTSTSTENPTKAGPQLQINGNVTHSQVRQSTVYAPQIPMTFRVSAKEPAGTHRPGSVQRKRSRVGEEAVQGTVPSLNKIQEQVNAMNGHIDTLQKYGQKGNTGLIRIQMTDCMRVLIGEITNLMSRMINTQDLQLGYLKAEKQLKDKIICLQEENLTVKKQVIELQMKAINKEQEENSNVSPSYAQMVNKNMIGNIISGRQLPLPQVPQSVRHAPSECIIIFKSEEKGEIKSKQEQEQFRKEVKDALNKEEQQTISAIRPTRYGGHTLIFYNEKSRDQAYKKLKKKEEDCGVIDIESKIVAPTRRVAKIVCKEVPSDISIEQIKVDMYGKHNPELQMVNNAHRLGKIYKTRLGLIFDLSTLEMTDTAKAFRPISLTSVYAKLLERLLLLRLQHYLEQSGKITDNQHAFRKGRSTQTALYEMFEFVQNAVNKRGGGVCVIVFLDISGAFDRTWHGGILHKLLSYKVPTYMVAIIKSYLQNRCVNLSESGRDYDMELSQGCPQGGVLSPMLWNILFNELLGMETDHGGNKRNRIKIIGYADDAALVCKADTVGEASTLLNVHLRKIHEWSIKNRVLFNSSKLAVLTICNRQAIAPPASVYYNGILVNEVTRYKYLGIIVDNKLNWKSHIDEVIKRLDRISRSLRTISGIEWGIKINIFRRIYSAIFLPVMTYGISIWGWKAAQKGVCARFDKEIRRFGMIAVRCMKTTSSVYIRCLLNSQCFEDILYTEVLNVSVRQFHIVHMMRQSTYDSYTKSIKRREYPQCIDHHYMMCRRKLNVNYMNLDFDHTTAIYDVHPARWVGNECIISNRQDAIWMGSDVCGMNIYTDASASSYGKGWSFVVYHHGIKICERKGSMTLCTVYQAELNAISNAVTYVINEVAMNPTEKVEIRSDCQSAVQTLKKYVQHESLQKEIHDGLRVAFERKKHICIRWIPGYSNILGNDDADRAAKAAVDSRVASDIKQTQSVIKNMIKQERKNNIQRDWQGTSAHTRALLPTMNDVHRFVNASPSSALCRIVSGHTRLNDFVCRKLKLISSAKCACGTDDETVSHFLLDCPKYQHIREKIWPDFTAEYDFITRDWEKLQKYVDETGRFRGGCR